MKRLLLAVFTYNRPLYLLNLVNSIEEFFPWGDRIIVDDGSSNPDQLEVLQQIATRNKWQVNIVNREYADGHGGYPSNIRSVLRQALNQGYDYLFILEDDVQFLWCKSDYLDYINDLFSQCPDAINLHPLFFRGVKYYLDRVEYIQSVHAYRTDRGFSPIGILDLSKIRNHPEYDFICDPAFERLNSAFWLQKGYRLYYPEHPTLAVIPWVESTTKRSHVFSILPNPRLSLDKYSHLKAQAKSYLLKPLDQSQIRLLEERNPHIFPYQEYLATDYQSVAFPIWHQKGQNMARFYYLCYEVLMMEYKRRGTIAKLTTLPAWDITQLPPCASHINPKPFLERDQAKRDFWIRKVARQILPDRIRHFIGNHLPENIFHYICFFLLTIKLTVAKYKYQQGKLSC